MENDIHSFYISPSWLVYKIYYYLTIHKEENILALKPFKLGDWQFLFLSQKAGRSNIWYEPGRKRHKDEVESVFDNPEE